MRRDWGPAREKVEREGECRACGPVTFWRLEAAHLWPRSMGGGMEPELIVPLCRICHAEFDAHQLDVLHLLTTEEQVAVVRAAGSIERARMRLLPSAYDAARLDRELRPELLREPEAEPVHLPALMSDRLGFSRSEARRLIAQGAVTLDGERVNEPDVDPARLPGRELRVGTRRSIRFPEPDEVLQVPLDPDLTYEECPACDGAGFHFDELGLPDSVCSTCDGEGYVVHGCGEVIA